MKLAIPANRTIVSLAVVMSIPAYFVFQPWALVHFRQRWRLAAAAPLALTTPAALWSLHALADGSNLWPLVFVIVTPFCTFYLLLLSLIKHFCS